MVDPALSCAGAYRHHGKIPDDFDGDILVPQWLNFDCRKMSLEHQRRLGQDPLSNNIEKIEDEVCNKSWIQTKLEERIRATGNLFILDDKELGFQLVERNPRTRIRAHFVDIKTGPRWRRFLPVVKGEDPFQPPATCKRWYGTIPAQCMHDSIGFLQWRYSQTRDQLLTPMVVGTRNAFTDRSIKNPFHPRWKGELWGRYIFLLCFFFVMLCRGCVLNFVWFRTTRFFLF